MTPAKITGKHRFPQLAVRGEAEASVGRTMQCNDSGFAIQMRNDRSRGDS